MTKKPRTTLRLLAALSVLAVVACSENTTPAGLGTQQLSVAGDTVVGSGQLSELKQRRAAWVARGINDYQFQLRISCFCIPDFTRPVLIEVRGGAVARVWDLETARPVTTVSSYPTITTLFDRAVAERSREGGYVSVAYDATYGFPARIEIGTLANDAGTLYLVGGFRPN